MNANAAIAVPKAPIWQQPTDAPDVLEGHGADPTIQMSRVCILSDVLHAARYIGSWGPGPMELSTLEQAVDYASDGFRCRIHRRDDVMSFIAEYVPGGLGANLREMDRDVRRELLGACIEHAEAKRKAIRSMMEAA